MMVKEAPISRSKVNPLPPNPSDVYEHKMIACIRVTMANVVDKEEPLLSIHPIKKMNV